MGVRPLICSRFLVNLKSGEVAMKIEVLEGEECWASEAIDDTDRVIRVVLDLSKASFDIGISSQLASDLCEELGKHSVSFNADLNVEKWLQLCKSLKNTGLSNQALEVESEVMKFISKHLSSS